MRPKTLFSISSPRVRPTNVDLHHKLLKSFASQFQSKLRQQSQSQRLALQGQNEANESSHLQAPRSTELNWIILRQDAKLHKESLLQGWQSSMNPGICSCFPFRKPSFGRDRGKPGIGHGLHRKNKKHVRGISFPSQRFCRSLHLKGQFTIQLQTTTTLDVAL